MSVVTLFSLPPCPLFLYHSTQHSVKRQVASIHHNRTKGEHVFKTDIVALAYIRPATRAERAEILGRKRAGWMRGSIMDVYWSVVWAV